MIQRLFTWRLLVVTFCVTVVITRQLILLLENCCEDHKNTILLTVVGSFAWYSGREHRLKKHLVLLTSSNGFSKLVLEQCH